MRIAKNGGDTNIKFIDEKQRTVLDIISRKRTVTRRPSRGGLKNPAQRENPVRVARRGFHVLEVVTSRTDRICSLARSFQEMVFEYQNDAKMP